MKDFIISDGRTLRALSKKYKFEYDPRFKYVTREPADVGDRIEFSRAGYKFKYFSGCFNPYVAKILEV